MNPALRKDFDNLRSPNRETSYKSYLRLMKATDRPVDWAYAVWDDLVEGLTDKDNHVRAIAAQLLANLPRSDPDGRVYKVDANGAATPFFYPDEKYIWAIDTDASGQVFVATGDPKGRILKDFPCS